MGEKQLVVKFVGGASGDTEESTKVTVCLPSAALGDIGRDRKSSLAQMGSQPESFIWRKRKRIAIDSEDDVWLFYR